jgi:large subunit ribosomal protein L10
LQFGFLNKKRLEAAEIMVLADLPSLEVLRSRIMGAIQAPAAQLARMINTPAQQLSQVIKAHAEKPAQLEQGEAA